jgi:hypothetical protein
LDSGPIIVTVERYLGMITASFPNTYGASRVVVVPYVSSAYTDARDVGLPVEASKLDTAKWWLFRGNMNRR